MVWRQFSRLSKAGAFEAFFNTLATMSSSAHLVQMFASTNARAHFSVMWAKEASWPASWPLAQRVHDLNPRESGRLRRFDRLQFTRRRSLRLYPFRDLARYRPRYTPACRRRRQRFFLQGNGTAAKSCDIVSAIPHKVDDKDQSNFFVRTYYKAPEHIQQRFGRPKRFKRVALRCEKIADNSGQLTASPLERFLSDRNRSLRNRGKQRAWSVDLIQSDRKTL